MKNLFVIGDIHGDFEMMKEVLKKWEKEKQQLLFLGDLNDRGPQSKSCFLLAKSLVEGDKAIYLMGNHEIMFLNYLESPNDDPDLFLENGGKETVESFLYKGVLNELSNTEIAMMIRTIYKDLIRFLSERPLYAEWGQYVFVHAGVDLKNKDWRKSTARDFLWSRKHFIEGKNRTGKTIVFGHTPTVYLNHGVVNPDVWQEDGKIGVDGGAVYGYVLYGVEFSKDGIEHINEVQHKNWKEYLAKRKQ
ncbi:MAG: serine/threonine protein phosphatase [Streptococcaceae bacterium]|nr:serine/threonine protein phosphatase [Streptococcaceae bacterium]